MKQPLRFILLALVAFVTVNAKCQDKKGKFKTLSNGKKRKKNCKWVQVKPFGRCEKDGAKDHCPETCGLCTPEPTMVPTPSPSAAPTGKFNFSWCKDEKKKFKVQELNNKKVDCKWAKENPAQRCSYGKVQEKCPVLCDFCCFIDNKKKFPVAKLTKKEK